VTTLGIGHSRGYFSLFGHELLTIIVHYTPILVSTLKSYRFCPLIGLFVSFHSQRFSMSLAKWVPSHFSPSSRFIALVRGNSRRSASQRRRKPSSWLSKQKSLLCSRSDFCLRLCASTRNRTLHVQYPNWLDYFAYS